MLNSEASLDDGAITGPYTGSSLPVPNRPDGEIPFCERAQVGSKLISEVWYTCGSLL